MLCLLCFGRPPISMARTHQVFFLLMCCGHALAARTRGWHVRHGSLLPPSFFSVLRPSNLIELLSLANVRRWPADRHCLGALLWRSHRLQGWSLARAPASRCLWERPPRAGGPPHPPLAGGRARQDGRVRRCGGQHHRRQRPRRRHRPTGRQEGLLRSRGQRPLPSRRPLRGRPPPRLLPTPVGGSRRRNCCKSQGWWCRVPPRAKRMGRKPTPSTLRGTFTSSLATRAWCAAGEGSTSASTAMVTGTCSLGPTRCGTAKSAPCVRAASPTRAAGVKARACGRPRQ